MSDASSSQRMNQRICVKECEMTGLPLDKLTSMFSGGESINTLMNNDK